MPSNRALHAMNNIHRLLQRLSGGRLGWSLGGMPVVELTTIGRKSGEARVSMLTSPLHSGNSLIVVASRGGDDHNPAWFLNLCAHPAVTVRIGGGAQQPMTARVASPSERAEFWPQITSKYRNYADYQTKTDREIPLVLLTPELPAAHS